MSSNESFPPVAWMFDLYESDEVWASEEEHRALIEELEIDPQLMKRCILFVLSYPFTRSATSEKQILSNPFIPLEAQNHHDFFGTKQ